MRFALALLTLVALAGPVRADERILSFDADITVHPDASMSVRETIRVRAEGVNIRRGIYRDFPTRYRDRFGNDLRVRFELQGVSRDGQVEPSQVEARSNGVRVYVGNPDVFLEPGEYTYVLAYETDRQLGYFAEHDELYWNVTGNGWLFPIDRVSARVRLPADVPASGVAIEGYTGLLGSAGRDVAGEVTAEGAIVSATRPLRPREGLTLAVTWPKGHVHEPDALARFGYLLADNRGLLVALSGLVLVLGYLHLAWRQHGRDPEPGVVFPHYEPPEGYSPASMRYIAEMGYDNRAFAAAVINLAVKGYLDIAQGDRYVLHRTAGGRSPLAAGERSLLDALFADGDLLELEQDNHRRVSAARAAHLKALQRDYERIYFQTNRSLLLPAAVIFALVLLALAVSDAFTPAVIVVLVLTAVVVLLYRGWLKAATPRGRALLDRLDGFRMYLEVAEKDELELRNPPEKTPELFERLLPFALALGVEQAWAERFAGVFARLEEDGAAGYRPAWYAGRFDTRNLGGFTKDVGRSFSSAIAAAAAPPGSSSGSGGGGFSGGGGGGGGGGGW
jgi:uncharacterized membrane protein YgcG